MNFYIPGFGSGPDSQTLKRYQEHIDISVITYDSKDPIGSLESMVYYLLDKCPSDDHINIFASSLGGWYAEMVASAIPCSLFLYNPSLDPKTSLAKYGMAKEVLEQYTKVDSLVTGNRVVCISTDDEVVDPKPAIELYKDYNVILSSGGHRMTDANINKLITAFKYEQTQL